MPPFLVPLAAILAGGSLIFIIFVVVMFFVVVYGSYTRRGSGIDQHPQGAGQSEGPGVGQGASRMSSGEDENKTKINSHGTG